MQQTKLIEFESFYEKYNITSLLTCNIDPLESTHLCRPNFLGKKKGH